MCGERMRCFRFFFLLLLDYYFLFLLCYSKVKNTIPKNIVGEVLKKKKKKKTEGLPLKHMMISFRYMLQYSDEDEVDTG